MITAKDVAERLGIAVSTVGRAMADDPRISAATKARVREVADQLGYVGSNPARIMRGASSKLIGLMIPDVANDFYGSVAQALSTCLDREGYGLVLALTEDDSEREARQIRELVGARAAGVILVPTARPKPEARALLARVPHIQLLRRRPDLGEVWFGVDDASAIRSATGHLLAVGHRRIAYIGGDDRLSTGAARASGYRDALAEAAVPFDRRLERLGPPSAAEFGEEAAKELLSLTSPPTAIVTGSVHVTLGLIRFVEHAGIETPQRLSVVGFGEAPWFSWWRGGLTAIQPPVRELATSCGLWLLEKLRAWDGRPLGSYSTVADSQLCLRKSVGPPPA